MTPVTEKQRFAKPFLKWAGGKGQLLNDIGVRLPARLESGQIKTYVEPFIGGGAVFFHIAQKYESVKHFYLSDINEDLINCYKAIKNSVESLICELSLLQDEFLPLDKAERREFYLNIRKEFNAEKPSNFGVKTAAKLIFLNKTCFNGLYRVNRKGFFNVPLGDYKRPTICDANNLRMVSKVLQKADLICTDFESFESYINNKTFVYLDPPYRPLSPTASFTSYSKGSFTNEDQKRLANFCKRISKKRGYFLLSNSDPNNEDKTDLYFDKLYDHFTIERVAATRAINCKGSRRGKITELLIRNYEVVQ